MAATGKALRASLRAAGFSQSAIKAAWPDWWSDEADTSPSARNELRFSLARKLGLDPTSLIRDEAPKFVWTDRTKYKRLLAETDFERGALASFGVGVARAVLSATKSLPKIDERELSALDIRAAILKTQPYVRLIDVLGACWAFGVPVVYLRVFPLNAKRMSAMAVHVARRYAILLCQDTTYPAPAAYYIAHELGHIALGHLEKQTALIDVGDPLRVQKHDSDAEELAADKYALELLTGFPEPHITTNARSFLARQLAEVSIKSAEQLKIEPGTIALCFGHSTGRWDKAYGALRQIYGKSWPAWKAINDVAEKAINWSELSDEMAQYLNLVLGLSNDG